MPALLQTDKENISRILKVILDVNVPPANVNEQVVKLTEDALIKLQSCSAKTHALGTVLQCIPKSPNVYGWLASCGTAAATRHALESNPSEFKASMACMNGMSQLKRAIELAGIGIF
ncbi:hypothetical protein [Spartinivicinus ruber]|uniref:hypothetical protein n=1 Tax=Spartinivicinus ruber TaxID=2683272 RepID=UPI0013D5094C|nr:hypothetical protein [Spartinivicinus ruber]